MNETTQSPGSPEVTPTWPGSNDQTREGCEGLLDTPSGERYRGVLFEQSFPRLDFQPQHELQLPHLGSHSCQQLWGTIQERLTQHGQGFGDDPTQDGVRRLTERVLVGWSPVSGTEKPKSGLQILASRLVVGRGKHLVHVPL